MRNDEEEGKWGTLLFFGVKWRNDDWCWAIINLIIIYDPEQLAESSSHSHPKNATTLPFQTSIIPAQLSFIKLSPSQLLHLLFNLKLFH